MTQPFRPPYVPPLYWYPPHPAPAADKGRSALWGFMLFLAVVAVVVAIIFAYTLGYNNTVNDVKECITSLTLKCPTG